MKVRKETKIGILVVVALALLFIGFNYLRGIYVFDKSRTFYGIYDKINGLEKSNPVVLNGFKVGQIKNIEIIQDGTGNLLVTMSVDKDFDIPQDTKALLRAADLLGSMQIQLVMGNSAVLAQSGDTLTPDIEKDLVEGVNEQIRPIKNKAEGLISSVDSVIKVIEVILNPQSQENLVQSFKGINDAIASLQRTSFRIDTLVQEEKIRISQILENINQLSAVMADNGSELDNIIKNFSQISDTLAKAKISETLLNANLALNSVNEVVDKINNGEGSLGMLINNPELYNRLESASSNLDLLVEDIRVNPNRYVQFSVFGRKNKSIELTKSELEQLKEYVKDAEQNK